MKKIVIFTLILIICGCVPVYRTHYTYLPPSDKSSLQCVNSCLNVKQSCEMHCEDQEQRCNAINDFKKTTALMSGSDLAYLNHVNGSNKCDNNKNTCQQSCVLNYNACYTNCGGIVDSKTECVLNCDQKSDRNRY